MNPEGVQPLVIMGAAHGRVQPKRQLVVAHRGTTDKSSANVLKHCSYLHRWIIICMSIRKQSWFIFLSIAVATNRYKKLLPLAFAKINSILSC